MLGFNTINRTDSSTNWLRKSGKSNLNRLDCTITVIYTIIDSPNRSGHSIQIDESELNLTNRAIPMTSWPSTEYLIRVQTWKSKGENMRPGFKMRFKLPLGIRKTYVQMSKTVQKHGEKNCIQTAKILAWNPGLRNAKRRKLKFAGEKIETECTQLEI